MLFLIAFAWLVASSFGFVLAILSPQWTRFQTQVSGVYSAVEGGIFYTCNVVDSTTFAETVMCVAFTQYKNWNQPSKVKYDIATAAAALSIACAGLSVITIWFSGLYFNWRRKNKCSLCSLITLSLLILLIFLSSIAVWILKVAETGSLYTSMNASTFYWPFWLAVGSSGGYLMSFISMLISFCCNLRRGSRRNKNLYREDNHF